MYKQHLSIQSVKNWIIKCLMLASVSLVGFSVSTLADSPNIPCPDGTTLVAKFEWSSGGYVFEKPAGNGNVVTVSGDATEGSWSAAANITRVILKGGTSTYTYEYSSAQSKDSFSKFKIPDNGGGNPPDISNIQFCEGESDDPPLPPAFIETEICDFIYGIHDDKLNDSQFIRIDPLFGFDIEPLGVVYEGYDIEAVDVAPDKTLYAAAGDETDRPGYLYKIDTDTGGILPPGGLPTGFAEIDGISFNPKDGKLWGWAQDAGLIEITDPNDTNPVDGIANSEIRVPMDGEFEDLTWSHTGDFLYIIKNEHAAYAHARPYTDNLAIYRPDPESDARVAHALWGYEVTTEAVTKICEIEGPEIEALETVTWEIVGLDPVDFGLAPDTTDDLLMLGYHNSKNQPMLAMVNPTSCEVIMDSDLKYNIPVDLPFDDIEGLGICLPPPPPPLECPPYEVDWMYVKDSFTDASGDDGLEIYGMAIKQEVVGDNNVLVVAINANLPQDGTTSFSRRVKRKIEDGHIGFSDLVFDFNGEKYAVHFSVGNDSSVTTVGLYEDVTLKDVGKENYGWPTFASYANRTPSATLGGLPILNNYFSQTARYSVPMSIVAGTKIDASYQNLDAAQLSAKGLDFVAGLGVTDASELGSETFGFSFIKPKDQMEGPFKAYVFPECINDGILMEEELECPPILEP